MSGQRWVLDSSAIQALFAGHEKLFSMVEAADEGRGELYLPAVSVADAEAAVRAGRPRWRTLLGSHGIQVLGLDVDSAIDIGGSWGSLECRQTAREARALGAVVLTLNPAAYQRLAVDVLDLR
jgi:predicted nucleic acid-binding protein